jgi:hypothetical protein
VLTLVQRRVITHRRPARWNVSGAVVPRILKPAGGFPATCTVLYIRSGTSHSTSDDKLMSKLRGKGDPQLDEVGPSHVLKWAFDLACGTDISGAVLVADESQGWPPRKRRCCVRQLSHPCIHFAAAAVPCCSLEASSSLSSPSFNSILHSRTFAIGIRFSITFVR